MNITIQEKQKNATPFQRDLFDEAFWPRRPYCTDNLEAGIRPRSLTQALTKPYIQANPPHLRIWSIYDIDRPGGGLAWEQPLLPPPAWSAVNKENGHAHLVWGLTAPVLVEAADMRQRPLRYLCAIEHAFRAALEADQGYSGLITKNPNHPHWRTYKGPQAFYDLTELAEYVDLPKFLPTRGKVELIGLGRNCTLFELLRQYAYRNIKKGKEGGYGGWLEALTSQALSYNGDFPTPLMFAEVRQIAKSTAKWTWHHFDIEASDRRFSQKQSNRVKNRWGDNEDKLASARLMAAKGMKSADIAAELGVHLATVYRWLKD